MILDFTKRIPAEELTYIENKLTNFLKKRLSNVNQKFPGVITFRTCKHAATFYYLSGVSYKAKGTIYIKFGYNLYDNKNKKEIFVSTLNFNTKNKREDGLELLDLLNDIAYKFDYEIISFESDSAVQGWAQRLRLPKIVDIFPTEFNKILLRYKKHCTLYNF